MSFSRHFSIPPEVVFFLIPLGIPVGILRIIRAGIPARRFPGTSTETPEFSKRGFSNYFIFNSYFSVNYLNSGIPPRILPGISFEILTIIFSDISIGITPTIDLGITPEIATGSLLRIPLGIVFRDFNRDSLWKLLTKFIRKLLKRFHEFQ